MLGDDSFGAGRLYRVTLYEGFQGNNYAACDFVKVAQAYGIPSQSCWLGSYE